jgi:protein-tyrosine phosphatase
MRFRILFVCYENICRSPMAEGVFRHLLNLRGLDELFEAESAGTVGYQSGSSPDSRAVRAASRQGIDITPIRAQSVHDLDLDSFHRIVVMDHENYRSVQDALEGSASPVVQMMTEFAGNAPGEEIEDPYYGPDEGFDSTLTTLFECVDGLISCLLADYGIVDPGVAVYGSTETVQGGRND